MIRASSRARTSLTVVTITLCSAALALLASLWAPLLLAAWGADLLRAPAGALERILHGRRRAAGVLVVLVVLVVLGPLAGAILGLGSALREMLDQLRAALEGRGTFADALLGGGGIGTVPAMRNWAELASRYGASTWHALSVVARMSASAAIAAVVFIAAIYTFLVDGERTYAWIERNAPIAPHALARLTKAFHETGRGLLIAGGGTALVQGALATALYMSLGIPRGMILGPLTAVCSLLPFIGTAIVWIPLAFELALSHQIWRAVVVVLGGAVVGVIDNVLRPALARYGRLELPMLVVVSSMLGGVALLGPMGALLGPLVLRVCVEALAIRADGSTGDAAKHQ